MGVDRNHRYTDQLFGQEQGTLTTIGQEPKCTLTGRGQELRHTDRTGQEFRPCPDSRGPQREDTGQEP